MRYRTEEYPVIAGVKKSIAWVDRLAWVALVFTASSALTSISGRDEIALIGIHFPVAGSVIGMVAITAAHFFISRHIIRSCADAWKNLSANKRIALFDDIVRTGGLMTKGADRYRGAITESKYSLELKTDIADPPTWIHLALVLFTLLSIVNIEWSLLALFQLCIAVAILLINWSIGESWLLCFGDLGSSRSKSLFFIDGTARPRAISHMSGLIISENISFRSFILGSIFESVLASLILWVLLLIPFFLVSGIILMAKSFFGL